MTQLAFAFGLSLAVALLAYWRGSLSPSGVAGALLVGTTILGFGGWPWGALLAIFFISSSLLSHYKEEAKRDTAEKFDKGHQRDFWQAMANGGLGALLAVASAIWPAPFWFAAYVGAMATVNADTWATELGTLSRRPPRLITSGRVVEVGTSGGISSFGTAVSLCGGLLIGVVAGLFSSSLGQAAVIGGLSGLAGSLFDSLLGATVQAIYYSDGRGKETERNFERDGTPNRHLRGWRWLTNDRVNFAASVFGALIALALSGG